MKDYLERIQVKGGVISPGELLKVIQKAESMGLDVLHFGSRQDILFPKYNNSEELTEIHDNFDTEYFVGMEDQNITSSYVAIDVFRSTPWLRGTTYLYILEEFRYDTQLKINIVDPLQQMVPLYYGELNFISSKYEDYWYLYTRLPGYAEEYYPVLVYTWDIAHLSELIEKYYHEATSIQALFHFINASTSLNYKVIKESLKVDFRPFPYYEGMNKMSNNTYWLGLYWRNNRYDLKFLKALCNFCVDHRIGKIGLTPWKSFIVKGIHKESRLTLEKLLGHFGINVRHSSLELNWHLPVDNRQALQLKKNIVLNFDQNDISTYGLTFAIAKHATRRTSYFTSIIIEMNPLPVVGDDEFIIRPTFNLVYAKNFNPNSHSYIVHALDVDEIALPSLLMELIKRYFSELGVGDNDTDVLRSLSIGEEKVVLEVYQCQDCQTIYDPSTGDTEAGIPPGTFFEDLPKDYCCSVCGADLQCFKSSKMEFTDK